MINAAFASQLAELAILLELEGENPFRIRAYQNAAQRIQNMPQDLGVMSRDELLEIPGIGKGMADHIAEFVKTSKIKDLEVLRKKFPPGILDLLQVPSLGPKRAKFLFKEFGVASMDALHKLAKEGKLRGLKGFGEKLETNILKGLAVAKAGGGRMLLFQARRLMNEILLHLKEAPGVLMMEPAGSLRRGKETIGDLDILCATKNPAAVIKFFTKLPGVKQILGAGDTKSSILLPDNIQCDLRVIDPSCFGAALQYFTGSKEHNVKLRERAQRMGYTINEYGLFRVSDKKQTKPLACKTEEEIYAKLGLQYIPPELRENRGEIEAAEKSQIPKLVEEKDVKGCFHNHTTESDGADSLEDMAEAARRKGWEWFVSADHSPSLKIARGLEPERLYKKMRAIEALNKKYNGFKLLCGSEVDILNEGKMDYADEILKKIDVVVGSVHSGFKQTADEINERVVRAMENPHVDCIGHLTGRLIGKRDGYAVDVDLAIKNAARTETALEINGQPDRQDINDVSARHAHERGAPLAVNTDAHSTLELNFMSTAVTVARRAWLRKEDLLNTKTWPELKAWLEK